MRLHPVDFWSALLLFGLLALPPLLLQIGRLRLPTANLPGLVTVALAGLRLLGLLLEIGFEEVERLTALFGRDGPAALAAVVAPDLTVMGQESVPFDFAQAFINGACARAKRRKRKRGKPGWPSGPSIATGSCYSCKAPAA